jgi:hypothetical protein
MTGRGQWCETYRCKQIDDESTGSECRRHNRLLLLDAPPATPPGPASTSTLGDRTSLARRGRPSLIYRWRRDLRAAANGFAQVLVAPTAEVSPYLHGFAELAHNLTRRRCPTGFDHRCDLLGRAPPYGGPRVRIHLPPAESPCKPREATRPNIRHRSENCPIPYRCGARCRSPRSTSQRPAELRSRASRPSGQGFRQVRVLAESGRVITDMEQRERELSTCRCLGALANTPPLPAIKSGLFGHPVDRATRLDWDSRCSKPSALSLSGCAYNGREPTRLTQSCSRDPPMSVKVRVAACTRDLYADPPRPARRAKCRAYSAAEIVFCSCVSGMAGVSIA